MAVKRKPMRGGAQAPGMANRAGVPVTEAMGRQLSINELAGGL